MRIGELAALVGVSTRTVRHYHHTGLLPEPVRLSNGYREYRLADAVRLARIRRLTELGLSLDEIADVLADDAGREIREVLAELDADLARQQQVLAARRERLAELLAADRIDPDATAVPEFAEVLRGLPVAGSRFAALDRDLLQLAAANAAPDQAAEFADLLRPALTGAAGDRLPELYRRLDELADADPADARVAALAAELAEILPAELTGALADSLDDPAHARWFDALSAELSVAQAAVIRTVATIVRGRR